MAEAMPKRGAGSAENAVTDGIIAAAIEVHWTLGPGLLESAYEECLCYELATRGIRFERQVHLPVRYKGLSLECGYKLDLLVEDLVIVELKTVERLEPVHSAQLLTYLKALNKRVGLLINFNVPLLKSGLKRIVNRYEGAPLARDNSASSAVVRMDDATLSQLPDSPRVPPRLRDSAVRSGPH